MRSSRAETRCCLSQLSHTSSVTSVPGSGRKVSNSLSRRMTDRNSLIDAQLVMPTERAWKTFLKASETCATPVPTASNDLGCVHPDCAPREIRATGCRRNAAHLHDHADGYGGCVAEERVGAKQKRQQNDDLSVYSNARAAVRSESEKGSSNERDRPRKGADSPGCELLLYSSL